MIAPEPPWSIRIALGDLGRGPVTLDLTPEAATERAIAKALRLVDLKGLSAKVRLSAWLDGVELNGEWAAVVTQVCGVSLDPFDTELAGVFQVRCAPLGSPLLSPPTARWRSIWTPTTRQTPWSMTGSMSPPMSSSTWLWRSIPFPASPAPSSRPRRQRRRRRHSPS